MRVQQQLFDLIQSVTGRLAATDHLIDHIVYHLYNLTPEEIAIVQP